MTTSRDVLNKLYEQIKQQLSRAQDAATKVIDDYKNIPRHIAGDLWDASASDGLGLAKQIDLAVHQASLDSKPTASMRFLHKKAHVLITPSQVQQLMHFNEDSVRGEDTAKVFAKVFGEGNIFDSETDSPEWKEQRAAFIHNLYTGSALTDLAPKMQEIVTDYMQELAESKGEIDLENLSTRFTIDMIGKTQLGFATFPREGQEGLSAIINDVIIKVANPLNSIETFLPEKLVNAGRWGLSYFPSLKSQSLDEIMAPGRQILSDTIRLNQENILKTDNWLTCVSMKKMWCLKKLEEREAKQHWPNPEAKKRWIYNALKSEDFNQLAQHEWPRALEEKSQSVVDLLYSPEVLNDVSLFLVVGHETSAKFFQYTLTLLADPKHRPVVEAMRKEIETYLAENDTTLDKLSKKDLANLIYSQAVLLEGLRLFPPVPNIKGQINIKKPVVIGEIPECKTKKAYEEAMSHRDKSKDVHLAGGSFVFMSPYRIQRSEAAYGKDAAVFSPERFIDEENDVLKLKKPNPNAWFPFGFGRRVCVGQNFVKQEVLLALVRFLMKYDFVVNDPFCYQTDQVFSLRPRNKVMAKISERSHESKCEFKASTPRL